MVSVNRKPTFHNNFQDSTIALKKGKVSVTLARETNVSRRAYNDNRWHHLALLVEADKGFSLYIDKRRVVSGDTDRMGTWHLWHVPTERLGMRVGPANRDSHIAIDELRVYNRPYVPR